MNIDFFAAMAARSDAAPKRWRRLFWRWLDGIETGWSIPLLLAAFVIIWTGFLMIAYAGGDLHPDVLETWTMGREFAFGYTKHPPLMAWIARAWTTVFPLTNWSFQLLAMVNAALALWIVDLIARRFVRGDKRAIVLMMLMILPVYQFHAQRFNANAVLLATWPLATYCFLRSFEAPRSLLWAIAAGAAAALAMLGKYYSGFLIAGFGFAALMHPQRRAYLLSPAPWIAAVAGFIVLAPHIAWLIRHDFAPFDYAMAVHSKLALGPALSSALNFLLGLVAYFLLPALIWFLMTGSRLARMLSDFCAAPPGLHLLAYILIATSLLPPLVTIALGSNLPPLWALQGLYLVPILVVCSTRYPIERLYTVNLAVIVLLSIVVSYIGAPFYALRQNADGGLEGGRIYFRQAAEKLTAQWHLSTERPLAIISGDENLAFAAAFYGKDHPRNVPIWKQAPAEGDWAAMCFADDEPCMTWLRFAASSASGAINVQFVVQPTLWGHAGKPARIAAVMVPR